MLVSLIFILSLLYRSHISIAFAAWAASYSWSSFSRGCVSLILSDGDPPPSDRGGVREHPHEPTRSGGTEPARRLPAETVRASAGRGGAVHPLWIRRNRRRAARAGVWTRSAVACEVGARSLLPTAVTKPGGSRWRGGWARR